MSDDEVTCPSCQGSKKEPDGKTACKTCGGTGKFKVVPTSNP